MRLSDRLHFAQRPFHPLSGLLRLSSINNIKLWSICMQPSAIIKNAIHTIIITSLINQRIWRLSVQPLKKQRQLNSLNNVCGSNVWRADAVIAGRRVRQKDLVDIRTSNAYWWLLYRHFFEQSYYGCLRIIPYDVRSIAFIQYQLFVHLWNCLRRTKRALSGLGSHYVRSRANSECRTLFLAGRLEASRQLFLSAPCSDRTLNSCAIRRGYSY